MLGKAVRTGAILLEVGAAAWAMTGNAAKADTTIITARKTAEICVTQLDNAGQGDTQCVGAEKKVVIEIQTPPVASTGGFVMKRICEDYPGRPLKSGITCNADGTLSAPGAGNGS